MTIKDAADILEVSRMTLRNWDRSGKLRAYRHPFNNYRVYKSDDIEKVLKMMESDESIIIKKKSKIKKLAVLHLK